MHNLRRFYYQNKNKIWKTVLIIALILALIQILNNIESSRNLELSNQVNTSSNTNIYEDIENNTYISNSSLVSGNNLSTNEVEKINETISMFLKYCKNGKAQEAYNMLSSDCKENEFNTLQKFKEKYLNRRFNKNSIYEIQNFIKDTYKVNILENKLATGNVNLTNKQIEYITIIEEDGQNKLNVNGYIGKEKINKQITKNNVKITVMNKNIYIDYEIYNFKVQNLSDKTIKIDSLKDTDNMYLEDESGNTYNAYIHEILDEDLEVKANREININIKYNNKYSNKTLIKNIIFDNIILDYAEYKKKEDTKNFEDICSINIAI